MTNPVPGFQVTYPFGERNSRYAAGYHTGDDYACPEGQPVVAPYKSLIVYAGWGSGGWGSAYGYQVIGEARFNGQTIRWAVNHLDSIAVHTGLIVAAGQRVGRSGDTGNITGPHVHYEERTGPFLYANRVQRPVLDTAVPPDDTPWDHGDVYVAKLRRGVRDSDSVRRLQWRLNHHGHIPGRHVAITGNYGEDTETAVQYWQRNVFEADLDVNRTGEHLTDRQANRLFGPNYRVIEERAS